MPNTITRSKLQTKSVYPAVSATFVVFTAFWRVPKRPSMSVSWSVGKLNCRRGSLSVTWLSASWFVSELSVKHPNNSKLNNQEDHSSILVTAETKVVRPSPQYVAQALADLHSRDHFLC